MSIFIVTLRDAFEQFTVAVFANDIDHAREVADAKYDERIVNIRRAK